MLPTPPLCLITDEDSAADQLASSVDRACAGGCRWVQLRRKTYEAADTYKLAVELRRITEGYDARLLINDRIDVALAVGADGVHLPGQGMSVHAARELIGPDKLLGRSVHSAEEVEGLAEAGLDYLQFGPVFFTPSKAAFGEPQGLGGLADLAERTELPVVAVGGIEPDNLHGVMQAGAAGAAVIRSVLDAADPRAAASALIARL